MRPAQNFIQSPAGGEENAQRRAFPLNPGSNAKHLPAAAGG